MTTPTTCVAKQILDFALTFLGVPYLWGGTTPAGFDCSGLTQYCYAHFGVNLPRVAADQYAFSTRISAAQAAPGDLVFYFDQNNVVDHCGIVVGGGQMEAAPHTGDVVHIQNIYAGAVYGRVLTADQQSCVVAGYQAVLPTSPPPIYAPDGTVSYASCPLTAAVPYQARNLSLQGSSTFQTHFIPRPSSGSYGGN